MGIAGATKVKWVGKGLTLKIIQTLNVGNSIDVDASALAYKIIGKDGGKPVSEIFTSMALHLKHLAHSGGFVVTVIFDGVDRPDCKWASLKRRKESFLNDANRIYCRLKASQLKAKYKKEGNAAGNKEKLDEYLKESKRLERICSRSLKIPENAANMLSERLMMIGACVPNENGGYVDESVITSIFQADSLIACRSVSNLNDIIYGEDSDYFVLLGRKCLLMWNMKKVAGDKQRGRKKKRKNDGKEIVSDATHYEVEIYGACNVKMENLQSRLIQSKANVPTDLTWKKEEYPLFSSVGPMLRVLVALTLGCDVFDGIKGISCSTINDKLKQIQNDTASPVQLFKEYMQEKMPKLDECIIETLVSAFIFEPGLIDETKRVESSYDKTIDESGEKASKIYVHSPPSDYRFPKFLESFSQQTDSEQQMIVDGPPVCSCNGFNRNGRHRYLAFEGSNQCSHCNITFCKTCVFDPAKDIPKGTKNNPVGRIFYQDDECKRLLCLDCFKSMRFGEDIEQDKNVLEALNVTSDEMRKILYKRAGLQLSASDITPIELVDLYEMYISSPTNTRDAIHLEQAKQKIKYPYFPSDSIGDESIFQPIGEKFPFSNGGRFISDSSTVNDEIIHQVMELLTSLLKYDDNLLPNNGQDNEQNSNMYAGKYNFLPSMFLNMAFHSRVDAGYRLIDRCARHTCDPKGGSIYYKDASFFEQSIGNNEKGTYQESYCHDPAAWDDE